MLGIEGMVLINGGDEDQMKLMMVMTRNPAFKTLVSNAGHRSNGFDQMVVVNTR
jgi:hypothetical protein